jgi:hypothetical protein
MMMMMKDWNNNKKGKLLSIIIIMTMKLLLLWVKVAVFSLGVVIVEKEVVARDFSLSRVFFLFFFYIENYMPRKLWALKEEGF